MANIGDYVLSLLELTPALSLSLALAALLALVFYLAKLADSYSDFKKIIINTNI
jgi:membrane associated rhomboid family serine protease